MHKENGKNILIGLFVVVGGCLLIWGLFFLNPQLGDGGQILDVRFTNIDKISVGTRVTFAGKPVGKVIKITEVFDARNQADILSGEVYSYSLVLRVDSGVKIFDTDRITIRTSGLMGERTIAIIPLAKTGNEISKQINDEIIYSAATGSMENAMEELTNLAAKAHITINNVSKIIEMNSERINLTINSIHSTFQGLDAAVDTLNVSKLIPLLTDASKSFTGSMDEMQLVLKDLREKNFWPHLASTTAHLDSIVGTWNQPKVWSETIDNIHRASGNLSTISENFTGSWSSFETALHEVSQTATAFASAGKNIDKVSQKIADGKGSMGRLVMHDDLYLRTIAVMGKLDTIMNDVNHYGVLFQNDKSWQRQRIKRMNVLNKLSSKEAFSDYFEQEMTQINSSLGRVATLLGKFNGKVGKQNDRDFKKAFARLLREVKGIEDTLTLYNQELIKPQE